MGYASDTTTATYAYDALDRRVAKTVDGAETAFVYDPWNPYRTVANDVVLDFTDGQLNTRWLHSLKVDEPLGFERYSGSQSGGSGLSHEMMSDRQGSVLQVVENAGNSIVAVYSYDSFGQRVLSGALNQRYGFTGREVDGESGLMYFRARHYDPVVGQFVQRDPIGFAGGDLNLYAYVSNDPYSYSDPSGLNAQAVGRGGTSTISWGIFARGAYSTASSGVAATYKACLRTPGCKTAGLKGLMEGVGALGEALGVGAPSGSSPAGTASGSDIVGNIVGSTMGLAENIGKFLTEMDPGDFGNDDDSGDGDGGDGGEGDGEEPGDEDPFGGSEQDAKDSKLVRSNKKANEIARKLGEKNAHELKRGLGDSKVDIYVNNRSGNVYLIPKNNVGWQFMGNIF